MCARVLKSESSHFKSDKWSHLRATGIGYKGRPLCIFFNTYASTLTFSTSSIMLDTWNDTEPLVGILVPATPSTLAFLMLCSKCTYTHVDAVQVAHVRMKLRTLD